MRVLVTGAAGFLGSAVCRAADERGDHVVGLVRPGELTEVNPAVDYRESEWGTDARVLAETIDSVGVDLVVHSAGATPRVTGDIVSAYEANVRLTWVVLAAIVASARRPSTVVVSSAAVYGVAPPTPTPEDTSREGRSHYALSKILAEDTVRAFVTAEAVRACIARPFNLLGRGEPAGSVVSDVVAQLRQNPGLAAVRLRETASVRDYLDVHDAAAALLTLAELGAPGEAYNVCSGVGTTIGELVSAILAVWGSSAVVEVDDPTAAGTVSIGHPEKLAALGWAPVTSVVAALEQERLYP